MPLRNVIAIPHPLLSRVADEIGSASQELAGDLVDTMYGSPACVGLAAPQIEVGLRAFVVDVSKHRAMAGKISNGLIVLFDPIVSCSGDREVAREVAREGCMSVPDFTCDVERYTNISVTGIGLDGKKCHIEAEGFEARAIQHEVDHLDGLLILDRVTGPHGIFQRKVYK
jgi:peptide deformylase